MFYGFIKNYRQASYKIGKWSLMWPWWERSGCHGNNSKEKEIASLWRCP
jgi:hypothetical protein